MFHLIYHNAATMAAVPRTINELSLLWTVGALLRIIIVHVRFCNKWAKLGPNLGFSLNNLSSNIIYIHVHEHNCECETRFKYI